MAVVVASMVAILITAVVVLLAVFVMHEITRSPQARMRLRRWVLAAATWVYTVRREVVQRIRHTAALLRRGFDPAVAAGGRQLAHARRRLARALQTHSSAAGRQSGSPN